MLLRQAQKWAEKSKRTFDKDLVSEALQLRADHDGVAANDWPEGSVADLMLVRWPSHGIGVPDVELLVTSLGTYWRFLRNTGRLRGSKEPASLVLEAKRAKTGMAEACADPANFGSAKGLLAFGREIGIDVDGAGSLEETNDRLAQIVTVWNNLPDDERLARSDATLGNQSPLSQAVSGGMNSLLQTGTLPPDWHLPPFPRLDSVGPFGQHIENELDDDVDLTEYLQYYPPQETVVEVRKTPYTKRLIALVDWVGDGKQVTSSRVLRPAVARQAYDELNLVEWDSADVIGSEQFLLDAEKASKAQLDQLIKERRDGWRTALDCRSLARLWEPALQYGLISVRGTTARAERSALPVHDKDWVALALRCLLTIAIHGSDVELGFSLVVLLTGLLPETAGGPVSISGFRQSWYQNEVNPAAAYVEPEMRKIASDWWLSGALCEMADAGVWVRDGDTLYPTKFGHDITISLIGLMQATYGEE